MVQAMSRPKTISGNYTLSKIITTRKEVADSGDTLCSAIQNKHAEKLHLKAVPHKETTYLRTEMQQDGNNLKMAGLLVKKGRSHAILIWPEVLVKYNV